MGAANNAQCALAWAAGNTLSHTLLEDPVYVCMDLSELYVNQRQESGADNSLELA